MKRAGRSATSESKLIAAARAVRAHAYAPYSGFRVGAALRTRDGRLFAGCNVENASFGAGICAERNAIVQAVAAGMRAGELEAIAVYTADRTLTPPCGVCLQVLVEFGVDATVILAAPGKMRRTRLGHLYPEPFTDFPRSRRKAGG